MRLNPWVNIGVLFAVEAHGFGRPAKPLPVGWRQKGARRSFCTGEMIPDDAPVTTPERAETAPASGFRNGA